MGQKGFSDEEYEAEIEQLDSSLARMEAALDGHYWLVAARFSIADICITPVIVRMEDIEMADMWEGKYPRVAG
ncbi:MAG: glutathione S-transferase domain-containing protein [Alphaproteobacteria bacterium]|nr:glutathione S-transferase domain-containing protein [Alphaproteobacteria bacterium]